MVLPSLSVPFICELEPIHVHKAVAGLRVVTEDRELFALKGSRPPIERQVEFAAERRPTLPVEAVGTDSLVAAKIQVRAQKNVRALNRLGGNARFGFPAVHNHIYAQ